MHRENVDFNNIIRGSQWVLGIIIKIVMITTTIIDKIAFFFSIVVSDRSQVLDVSRCSLGQE